MIKCRVLKNGYCELNQGYNQNHYGVDVVGANYTLDNVVAHSDGVVVKVRNNCNKTYSSNALAIKDWGDGFGNYVMIDHQNGFFTQYEHLAYNTVKVKVGDKVKKGDVIGYMGSTGNARGAHLHFQVNKSEAWNDTIDPISYLDKDFIVDVNIDNNIDENRKLLEDIELLKEEINNIKNSYKVIFKIGKFYLIKKV